MNGTTHVAGDIQRYDGFPVDGGTDDQQTDALLSSSPVVEDQVRSVELDGAPIDLVTAAP